MNSLKQKIRIPRPKRTLSHQLELLKNSLAALTVQSIDCALTHNSQNSWFSDLEQLTKPQLERDTLALQHTICSENSFYSHK